MPGLHITDQQVHRYMSLRRHHTLAVAAAKAGISERSARRIDKNPQLPSQKKRERHWRTRPAPLEPIWPRVEELLKIPGSTVDFANWLGSRGRFGLGPVCILTAF